MSGPGFIVVEPDEECELCHKMAETRPYGPNGERVCFECGMKDPEAANRGISRYVFDEKKSS